MRLALLVVGGWLSCSLFACGSDDSPSGSGGASGATTSEAGKATTTAGTHSSGGSGGSSTAGTHAGTATGGASGGSAKAGGSSGGSGALSEACQKFCDCHEANCSALPIPDGKSCADFCAAMTADQLACRQNMCGLVPAQPDNDHCKHSLGINECL